MSANQVCFSNPHEIEGVTKPNESASVGVDGFPDAQSAGLTGDIPGIGPAYDGYLDETTDTNPADDDDDDARERVRLRDILVEITWRQSRTFEYREGDLVVLETFVLVKHSDGTSEWHLESKIVRRVVPPENDTESEKSLNKSFLRAPHTRRCRRAGE
ncbi:hypothetical protein D9619_012030 [Psilocybe cf. subviscida]|uniref:Uncharacterized protein n=1 Tax=Psilocybe cf. subviscida TaxID=2480587 RepID=A0A8H5B820_9AGAR|nr:hypothetical protein D9619_012030 [Psilocybe cf. subviscida]